MKINKLIISIVISAVCCYLNCTNAQATSDGLQEVRAELDRAFSGLNKDRIPTQILLDYAINYADVKRYDGTSLANSTLVNRHIFLDILKTVDEASGVNTPLMDNAGNLIDSITEPVCSDGTISLAYTCFRYNTIKDNAIQDGLLRVENGILSDVTHNGVWINPYDEKYLFAMTTGVDVCTKSSVNYTILNNQQLKNESIQELYFDAGDNAGYRNINTTVSSSVFVNYNTDGEKRLRLKAVLENGTILESHSKIIIKSDLTTSTNGTNADTFITELFSSDYSSAKAQLSIFRPAGANGISKPFIVVEGFDPWELINILPNRNVTETGSTTREYCKTWFKTGILSDYDYMYVDWYNATVDIRTNAEILIKIINYVNEIKTSNEPLIIMGQSMGGLITRYALCTMEAIDIPHQVSTYISYDSPHLGANLPLGIQYFITQLLSLINNYPLLEFAANLVTDNFLSNAERTILDTLHSDAAKQMLLVYLNEQGQIDDSHHRAWLAELDQLGFPQGDYGKGIENLAIVNGGVYNIQDYLVDGHLIHANINGSSKELLSSFLLYVTYMTFSIYFNEYAEEIDAIYEDIKNQQDNVLGFHANIEVNPYTNESDGPLLSKLNLQYTYKPLFSEDLCTKNIFDSEILAPFGLLGFDDYYGSMFCINSKNISDSTNGWAGEYSYNIEVAESFMFIPVASALAYKAGMLSKERHINYYSCEENKHPIENIPFDAYYLSSKTTEHINIDEARIEKWISNQINMKIEGPGLVTHSATFNVSGVNTAIDWNWESSNEEIAYFEDNGKLIAKGNGFVTITASSYNNGELYRKQRVIKVGMPEFCITKQYYPNVGYQFTATVTDSEAEYINELVANGDSYFEWKLIDSNGELKEIESSGATATYMVAEDELVTIAVCLVNSDGNKSHMRTLTLNLQTPFSVNYKYMVVDSMNHFYWVKEDGTYETGNNTEDLIVTFRHLPLGSEDNLTTLVSKYIGNGCTIYYDNVRQSIAVILHGEKVFGQFKWVFPFFDQDSFTQDVRIAMALNEEESLVVSNYDMKLVNSRDQVVQYIPFAVLYKPVFPDPLAPPTQLNPIIRSREMKSKCF